VTTAVTKIATGWWAAGRQGIGRMGRARAGTALVARGEFSIVIAGLAVTSGAVIPQLAALATTYVLLMAVLGPVLARLAEPAMELADRLPKRRPRAVSAPGSA
jgi:CPA2 family monovalent cation:H+ antiporter-2